MSSTSPLSPKHWAKRQPPEPEGSMSMMKGRHLREWVCARCRGGVCLSYGAFSSQRVEPAEPCLAPLLLCRCHLLCSCLAAPHTAPIHFRLVPYRILSATMPIAPITGRLRKGLWRDIFAGLGLGIGFGYAYWCVHLFTVFFSSSHFWNKVCLPSQSR